MSGVRQRTRFIHAKVGSKMRVEGKVIGWDSWLCVLHRCIEAVVAQHGSQRVSRLGVTNVPETENATKGQSQVSTNSYSSS